MNIVRKKVGVNLYCGTSQHFALLLSAHQWLHSFGNFMSTIVELWVSSPKINNVNKHNTEAHTTHTQLLDATLLIQLITVIIVSQTKLHFNGNKWTKLCASEWNCTIILCLFDIWNDEFTAIHKTFIRMFIYFGQ